MAAHANPNRRGDIAAALRKAKTDAQLSLEDLATIWGVQKSRFVTVKNGMTGFPPPIPQGTSHVFNARQALTAMRDWDRRHDVAAQKLKASTDRILGVVRQRGEEAIDTGHTPRDLSVLSRMAAEVEERERAQGMYVPRAEVARVCGEVFSEISDFCSRLSNEIDPHGRLETAVRTKIDGRAKEALSRVHRKMRDMLVADAERSTNRSPARGSGKPRTRR